MKTIIVFGEIRASSVYDPFMAKKLDDMGIPHKKIETV